MSLLFYDGVDAYTATADIAKKWNASSGASVSSGTGRFGGNCLQMAANSFYTEAAFTGAATIVAGGATYRNSIAASGLMQFREGTTIHIEVGIRLSGGIYVKRGFTEIFHGAIGAISSGVWQEIEIKVNIHDTTGTVDVWVDGINVVSISGTDTRNGGTGVCDNVRFFGSSATTRWDDCYVLDTAGSAPQNNVLGDARVDTLRPDGDGNYTEFGTVTGGSTHYTEVDDSAPDSDTTKITSTAANQRDTFTMGNLAAITSQTIFGVQHVSYAKRDGTATNFRHKFRISATDYDKGSKALTSAYTYYVDISELDPNAGPGAWVESVINGLESGVESL